MNEMYKQQLLDRFHALKFRGELTEYTHQSTETNSLCGDAIQFQIHIKNDKVMEAKWQGKGCAISLVAADMVAEKIIGMSVAEIQQLHLDDIRKMLGIEIRPSREKCAELGLKCVKKAAE